MKNLIPAKVPDLQARPDDPRFAELLGAALRPQEHPKLAIVGFPSDEGAARNGGRSGAAEGPAAFREQFYRLTPDPRTYQEFIELLAHTRDLGDIDCSGSLADRLNSLTQVVSDQLSAGTFVVIIGGTHDLTLAHWRSYSLISRPVAVINIDSHLDVRPVGKTGTHSGSAFREIIETHSSNFLGYTAFGANPWSVAKAHLDFMQLNNCTVRFGPELSESEISQSVLATTQSTLLTFDLDSLSGFECPGVSAPAAAGISAKQFFASMESAGLNRNIHSCDLVELNPRYDMSNQSARVTAVGVWHLLRGFSRRK